MADSIVTYIDGESHYERLLAAWRKLHGRSTTLHQLRFKNDQDERLILHVPDAKVFWTRRWSPGQRVIYFTAVSGDLEHVHSVRAKLTEFGLEHHVVHEKKRLAEQRKSLLERGAVIEKAKGVDCALIVRMLEEAQSGLFTMCNLYTSDVDYLPVIQAVKNKAKRVLVHGFKNGLGELSEMLVVPHQFIDLEEMLERDCHRVTKTG